MRTLREAMGLGQALSHTGSRPKLRSGDAKELMQAAADIISSYWDDSIADDIRADLVTLGVDEKRAFELVDKLGDVSNLRWEVESTKGGDEYYDMYQREYDEVMDELRFVVMGYK